MRCSDCNKFVSYAEPEGEVELNSGPDIDGQDVKAEARVFLTCAECGAELKEATLEMSKELGQFIDDHTGPGHELTVEDGDAQPAMRSEGSGRYTKTFYGAQVTFTVKCSCGEELEESMEEHVQANGMEELQ